MRMPGAVKKLSSRAPRSLLSGPSESPWVAVNPKDDQETIATAQSALAKLGLSRADLAEARELLWGEIHRLEAGLPANYWPANYWPASYWPADQSNLWWTFSTDNGKLHSQQLPTEARQLFPIAGTKPLKKCCVFSPSIESSSSRE